MTTDRNLEGVLYPAIRQYLHNDGSSPVFGYDIAIVDAYVQTLHRQIEALEALQNERDRHVPDRDSVAFTTINGVDICVGEDITDGVYTLSVLARGQDGSIFLVHTYQHRCATGENPRPYRRT